MHWSKAIVKLGKRFDHQSKAKNVDKVPGSNHQDQAIFKMHLLDNLSELLFRKRPN